MSDLKLATLTGLYRLRATVYDAEGFSDLYFTLTDAIQRVKGE